MKKSIAALLVVFSLFSCKTKQQAVSVAGQAAEGQKTAKEIAEGHYANKRDFKTLYIKGSADYKDSKTQQGVSLDIRIKKDEIILVSVRLAGLITVAKAIITPDRVSYYERGGNTYFDGNYSMLSRWMGTELNFAKVQNILLGGTIDDLTKGLYLATIENGQYKVRSQDRSAITREYFFEGGNYLLKKQTVIQAATQSRSLEVAYPEYKEYPKAVLPAKINISAEQKDKVAIDIDYNTITFDENLTFPYEVPEGFEQIFLD